MSQGYSEIEIFNNIYHVNLATSYKIRLTCASCEISLNPTEKAINTFTDAKIEERIRRMAEKDADTIQAEYEARLEEAVRVRHEIQRGRPFIVVDEMDKPVILRSLYPDMRDTFLSTRSNPHPLTPLNKKLHVSVTPVKTDHDTHRQCKGVIIPIQTFNDMQIEDEVKQFLSDILKKIKD
ncbi:PREDICTED: uncharacterized protein LOC106110457 isoform X1 [Papilio polytes]|uniref:uncharacterized protein LOC106110457 isoform X1 n=1 Tax=Papilio polytes TaxID=76194 RepID=UPI0006760217|nr:PREDICTED: uncharacterized protein LOC106110457 isoform X1 [Papilio polytes]